MASFIHDLLTGATVISSNDGESLTPQEIKDRRSSLINLKKFLTLQNEELIYFIFDDALADDHESFTLNLSRLTREVDDETVNFLLHYLLSTAAAKTNQEVKPSVLADEIQEYRPNFNLEPANSLKVLYEAPDGAQKLPEGLTRAEVYAPTLVATAMLLEVEEDALTSLWGLLMNVHSLLVDELATDV